MAAVQEENVTAQDGNDTAGEQDYVLKARKNFIIPGVPAPMISRRKTEKILPVPEKK